MAKIPGIVFIILGIIVAIISYFIVKQLFVFTFVGVAFIIWGIGKVIIERITNPKPKTTKENSHHNKNQEHSKHIHDTHQEKIFTHVCPYCHSNVRLHDNFCPQCGVLLKHNGRNIHLDRSSYHKNHHRYHN